MDLLLLATLLIVGFVGCAEFASVALVHPIIRRLPEDQQLVMEQGLLRTYGMIMPVGMTLAAVLPMMLSFREADPWFLTAGIVLTIALIATILGNVPINLRTFRIKGARAPKGFIPMRRRWDIYQAIRGSLQLAGFVLVSIGIVA
ncbi:anthrone oxygenase family protein [Paeniglutamicibacter sp. MACA_103]|uniref:anthrone oxygenase family protein n=1 Tax=Paeniglutamicibacter sp. MACA_103 TaxID=3377337 RepID=UPI003894DFB1